MYVVISSIRKTGCCGAPVLPNFRNSAEAVRAWPDNEEQRLFEERKRLVLEQRMKEARPKVFLLNPSRSPRSASSWGKWQSSLTKPRAMTSGRTVSLNGTGTGLPAQGWLSGQHAYPEKHGCRMVGEQGRHPHRNQHGVMNIRCRHRIPSPEAVGFVNQYARRFTGDKSKGLLEEGARLI